MTHYPDDGFHLKISLTDCFGLIIHGHVQVKLEHPHEVLIRVSGYYGPVNRDEKGTVIKSLTFYTSRGQYGPFGEEIGTYFSSTTTQGKVVGFHGRSGAYLDAIGVHMQHWLGNSNNRTSKPYLFKMFT